MMTMSSRCAGGIGHHAFYLHPEANVGNGATPDGDAGAQGEGRRTAIPESTTRTAIPAVTGTTPDPATESTTIH